ncbi:MAG TPA: NAD(P)/FAD-dependent oxidoreductase [Saprospiraceae bacterium]|nr:NAD(P)/FAD-dependent oxidoreductase [Saprospiraceae bacterium]
MHLPSSNHPRIVVVGGGFAGLELIRQLKNEPFQVVLIDRNNYFTFQPLLYQVATAGLELTSVVYPFRRILRRNDNVLFRLAEVTKVDPENHTLTTSIGEIAYDYLVLATGSRPIFFGLPPEHLITMKTTEDALYMRNTVLTEFERAVNAADHQKTQRLINLVIVGGGPTGVELAGAFAEMRKYVLPRDYPELDLDRMKIYLVEGLDRLLPAMSEQSSRAAQKFLENMGVSVRLNQMIEDYDGASIRIDDEYIPTHNLIWTAGVKANRPEGLTDQIDTKGNRMVVDRVNRLVGYRDVYAIGDVAAMLSEDYPAGHPQLAPVAQQQGKHLAKNLVRLQKGQAAEFFNYNDKGTMATIGRNKAVADLPFGKTQGTIAWFLWMLIHLITLVGFRNKVVTLINWMYGYFRNDRALRIIQRQSKRKRTNKRPELSEDEMQ